MVIKAEMLNLQMQILGREFSGVGAGGGGGMEAA